MELYSEFFKAKRRFCIGSEQATTNIPARDKEDVLREIPFSKDVIQTCDKICRILFNCSIFKLFEICKIIFLRTIVNIWVHTHE